MLWLAAIVGTVFVLAMLAAYAADAHDENAAMREFAQSRDAGLRMWREGIAAARKEEVEV